MQGKVLPERSALVPVYVGIDVCKAWLDVYLHPIGRSCRMANDREGLKRLKRWLAKYQIALIVMEATGKFHRQAHRHLHAGGLAVAIVNPLRARLFAEAMGTLAKTDAIDARMLALIAATLEPKAKAPPPQTMETLQEVVRGRDAFVRMRTALLNQLEAATVTCLKREIRRQLEALERAIDKLQAEIERIVAADPALARRLAILTSIPGIGTIAAITLLANFAELGTCTGKQAAMIAGLAPIACDSGDSQGARHIKGGRASLRTGVYMPTLCAARFNPDLKCFYARLRGAGKKPKVALVAVMRKLVTLANTLIREDRLWQPRHA